MKRNQKFLVVLLCLTLCLTMTATYVGALQIEEETLPSGGGQAEVQWKNTSSINVILDFLDGVGYAEGIAEGDLEATRVRADVYVYRQHNSHWILVGEDHSDFNDFLGGVFCEFNIIPYAVYRADFTFIVTKDGYDETITRTAFNVNGTRYE